MSSLKQHWENVYKKKSNHEMSWFQKIPHTSLKLISTLNLNPDSPVIDVGGGNSNLINELFHDGFSDLTVLDISEAVIDRKKDELGTISNHIEWIVCNVLDLNNGRHYQLWHDRATFHFLTEPKDIKKYVHIVGDHVVSGGFVILSAFSKSGPEKCSGLPVTRYSVEKIETLLSGRYRLLSGFEEIHSTPLNTEQNFVFTVFQKIV
jgi:2-polyprenyl-3-methyl-5-hydroxy-6-metoxy-1,4-benzoquinol methylase